MSRLTFRYKYDASFSDPKLTRDDFGRLSVSVEVPGFSGRGGFWVQWQDVKEFGEALAEYPIAEDAPVGAQWGYDMQQGDNLILRIEVADDYEAQNRVRGSFLTNYPDLDAFRLGIAKLMDSEIEEAVLIGR